tara:strand:- start:237 stop:617 length:381 start_codon:yes stop_codon:yes gene_type:complete
MSDTGNIIGVKALHNGVMSLEQRVEILEELLLVKPHPVDMPSPAVIEPELKSNAEFERLESKIETLEATTETTDSELSELKYTVDELEETGVMSEEQMTNKIKYWLQRFLRNALNLEVSFDDKRQT